MPPRGAAAAAAVCCGALPRAAASARGNCSSDADCSLNGACAAGACRCDPPWSGAACGVLNFRPLRPPGAAYGYAPNVTSWGGNPVLGDDGLYHMFVTEIAGRGCGLTEWNSQSQVAHAAAATPAGPYERQGTALWPEAHNPQVLRVGGEWLLFHIGSASNHTVHDCGPAGADAAAPRGGAVAAAGAQVHRSASPFGPWVSANTTMPLCVNPSPWVLADGRLAVACTGPDLHHRNWTLLTADGLMGPWQSRVIFPGVSPDSVRPHKFWEDPFLWVDARGRWHILAHCYVPHYDSINDYVSGHLFSEDGVTWQEGGEEPYRHDIRFSDGTAQNYSTIERPKLLFDDALRPTHLFNGASSYWPCTACGGCTSCKVTPGTDWTYTIVRELAV